MKRIRDAVVNAVHRHAVNDEQLICELNRIVEETGEIRAYSIFFKVMTHMDLKPEAAESFWRQIVTHRQRMSEKMGREVNFRTAMCDYFCTIDKTLKNPIVVDIHVFEGHLNSLKHDKLTGLFTRATFEDSLKREISRAKRYENDLSILFFDIDDFKQVNDQFGHLAGDLVLKEIARVIQQEIRIEDAAGRYGGEEMVVVLPETGKVEGLILAERIRETIEATIFPYDQHRIRCTISGGLATFPIDAQDATQLLKCADTALYRAKEFGKNHISVYSHDKRRYLRVDYFSSVQVKQLGDNNGGDLYGNSKNISVAGIFMKSETFIEIGTKVQLQITFDDTEGPLWIIGTVVRVETRGAEYYDMGISFMDLDLASRNEITRYMIRQLERVV